MTYLICLIFGLLTALPLIFGELSVFAWFTIAPLFYIARKYKRPYLHGLVFSFGYYALAFSWFISMYPMDFVDFTKAQAIGVIALAAIGIPLYQGAELAFVAFFYSRFRAGNKYLAPVTAAALWVIIEWFQTKFWFGVPYARLALTQARFTPAIQSASIFGSLFVSFLIVLSNGYFSIFISSALQKKKRDLSAVFGAGIIIINCLFGAVVLMTSNGKSEKAVHVACIQGNISSRDKSQDFSTIQSLEIYETLTRQAVQNAKTDLVIWPETAIPTTVLQKEQISERISELSEESGAIIITGAFNEKELSDTTTETTNSIIIFYPDGTISDTIYSKRNLVPFGEYIPMEGLLTAVIPSLSDITMFKNNIVPGNSPSVFTTEFGKIGGLICFDSIYDAMTLESVRSGAELIVILTNDSWANGSSELYQHESHAIMRAVESGRYVARAANTGISSVIDSHGRILASEKPMVEGFVSEDVVFSSEKTLYSVVGNILVLICFSYIIVIASLTVIKNRKQKKVSE